MPELPEVETIRCQLDPRLKGRTVVGAWSSPNPKFLAAVDAVGATITGVRRRGKYLIIGLYDGRELVVHLGMTGVLRHRPAGNREPHVRAAFALDDGSELELHDVRQFGRVAVVAGGDYSSLPTLHALGPEPFDDTFTAAFLYRALNAHAVAIKTQLLNQRVVAGVGNIYADEALWQARVHPASRRITRAEAVRLRDSLVLVLQQGIRNGGTTLRDYRGFDGATGSNQHDLACYGHAGKPCRRCGKSLHHTVIAARGTTYCRTCQRPRA